MPTKTETFKDCLMGDYATPLGNADAKSEVGKVFTEVLRIAKSAADATDSTTTAATALVPTRVREAGLVRAAFLNTSATITGSSTNNATFTLKAYPAAGVTGVTVATLTTSATITAFTAAAFTLATTATNLSVVQNAVFTLEIAKGGTGITLPISSVDIHVERVGQ